MTAIQRVHGYSTVELRDGDRARLAGYACLLSRRAGATGAATMANLAVAIDCVQIGTGSPWRSDRMAKYNQMLRNEDGPGAEACFPGRAAQRHGAVPGGGA